MVEGLGHIPDLRPQSPWHDKWRSKMTQQNGYIWMTQPHYLFEIYKSYIYIYNISRAYTIQQYCKICSLARSYTPSMLPYVYLFGTLVAGQLFLVPTCSDQTYPIVSCIFHRKSYYTFQQNPQAKSLKLGAQPSYHQKDPPFVSIDICAYKKYMCVWVTVWRKSNTRAQSVIKVYKCICIYKYKFQYTNILA